MSRTFDEIIHEAMGKSMKYDRFTLDVVTLVGYEKDAIMDELGEMGYLTEINNDIITAELVA